MSSRAQLEEVGHRIGKALAILDTDTADGIIGQPGEEHRTLVQGTEAAIQMLWMAMKSQGAADSKRSQQFVAQTELMLLQMIHFAYALGIKRGREHGTVL